MKNAIFKPLLENISARKLITLHKDAGYDLRFVGGCVRDCLIGESIGDIDMATTATPEQGQGLLKKAGIKTIPTGIDHGTITAVIDGQPFEITTLRSDVTTDGRRATVVFTSSWLQDAERRDFTVNAMSLDGGGALYDPFDGQADLKAGRIRFIGDAGARIIEDALRILRFFRFNAHVGTGDIDGDGLNACTQHASLLENLSKERIRAEVLKLLQGQNVIPVWQTIVDRKINQYFLKKSININCLEKLFHVKHDFKPILLALFEPADRDGDMLQAALKLSNKETARIKNALTVYNDLKSSLNEALYFQGAQAVTDATFLRYGDRLVDEKELRRVIDIASAWQKPVFPITGDDLIKVGYAQGKAMGDKLKALEKYWIDNDFKPTREECLAQV